MCVIPIGASAASYGGQTMRPYLDYVFTADGFSCSAPTIATYLTGSLGSQQVDMNFYGNQENLSGASVFVNNVNITEFEYFKQADASVVYDFVEATVDGERFTPIHFDFQYAPFVCRFRDMFEYSFGSGIFTLNSLRLFDTIGCMGVFYGTDGALVSGEFTMRVNYVGKRVYDSFHGLDYYDPLTHEYKVSFINNMYNGSFSASQIDLDGVSFRDVTDGVWMTFNEFISDIVNKTSVLRTENGYSMGDLYIDIESCRLDIDVTNAPFSALGLISCPYIDPNGYDWSNSLFWDPTDGNYEFRQQYRGNYVALITANNLNTDEITSVDFEGDRDNPLVRIPALFIRAVGEFFSIDFFGLGFTIGHLVGIVLLASIVLIFLKVFAGG